MSENFLEVVVQSAQQVERNFRYRPIEIVADHVVAAAKAGRDLPWVSAAEPQNLHLLAAVAGHFRERGELIAEPGSELLDKVEAAIEAIDTAVANKLVEVRKVEYTHANGWRIVLDCDQVFPDDPGAGAPAMVYTPKGSSATLYCACEMGEVEYEAVPGGLDGWLEHFLALYEIVETRTHPSHRN